MVLQKCIPISLMLGVEIINYLVAWRIGRKTGSSFNYKVSFKVAAIISPKPILVLNCFRSLQLYHFCFQMTAELGHVSHMVLDCNTISGSQVDVVDKYFTDVTLVG